MTRTFSGGPEARWLTEDGVDRRMELLASFWFRDSKGRQWDAPKGSRIDGASIPRPLWAIVGSPYTGDYRRASIVHDVACDQAVGNDELRRSADRMFFEACRAGGCSWWDAAILYVGVRFGSLWNGILDVDATAVRLSEAAGDDDVQRHFAQIAQEVVKGGETDNPEVIEARTDKAMQQHALYSATLREFLAS